MGQHSLSCQNVRNKIKIIFKRRSFFQNMEMNPKGETAEISIQTEQGWPRVKKRFK